MCSRTTAQFPLPVIYVLVDGANSPFDVLGVRKDATADKIRNAYHALALRIHPDKAPEESLLDTHTKLFQKVQAAYNEVLRNGLEGAEETVVVVPKELPETWESLHARNCEFKENLRVAREKELKIKRGVDAEKAAKQAKAKAKFEKLAEKRTAREQGLLQEYDRRQAEIEKEKRSKPKDKDHRKQHKETAAADQKKSGSHPNTPNGDEKTDRFPKSRSGALWDAELDERLVSDAEVRERWHKHLLSGCRTGSVSLSQKKQRDNSAAAMIQEETLRLTEEIGDMLRSELTEGKPFTPGPLEEMMDEAFTGVERRDGARVDQGLKMMDKDVVEQYYLEDHQPGKSMEMNLIEYVLEQED